MRIHELTALSVGVPVDVIDAIARHGRLAMLLVGEAVMYDFCLELHLEKCV